MTVQGLVAGLAAPLTYVPAPRPVDGTPSRFVSECLGHLPSDAGFRVAADLGAGYGRHSRILTQRGFKVLAIDIDARSLKRIAAASVRSSDAAVLPVMADLNAGLPVRENSLDLVVGVHFDLDGLLPEVACALKSGGMLLYETPDNRGMNWQALPRAGQLKAGLGKAFELLIYRERPAGPARAKATVVHLLARKRGATRPGTR